MRLILLLTAACALQGCATLIGGVVVTNTNRQRRAAATTRGSDLAERPLTPGDTLTLVLAGGETRRGPVVGVTQDSLALDAGTFALPDIERVVRPWTRARADTTLVATALVDAAILFVLLRSATFGYSDAPF